ncbi:MAG: hypothetical protein J0I66_05680, partial [Microbacterium sp.]|nr:hypothetical protein [Microbacterium sp.]
MTESFLVRESTVRAASCIVNVDSINVKKFDARRGASHPQRRPGRSASRYPHRIRLRLCLSRTPGSPSHRARLALRRDGGRALRTHAPPNDAAPEWTGEVAPAWTGEVETTAQHAAPERAEAQPAAAWQDERNVYRPSFSAPGYASHPATEETPRHYGAV